MPIRPLKTPFQVPRAEVESIEEMKGQHWPALVALGLAVTLVFLIVTFGQGYPSD